MGENIVNYLLKNYKEIYYIYNDETEIEINSLINKANCSIKVNPINYYSISGISNIIFTKIIPNLFRQCYIYDSLKLPNICPSIVQNGNTSLYFPNLIEEKYIKSLLYYNFPANSKIHYTIEDLIKNTARVNNLFFNKKTKQTYDSKTIPLILFSEIYSESSMLFNLLKFNNYINYSNHLTNLNLLGQNFSIEWDCTLSCFCSDNFDDLFILGNQNNDIIINFSDVYALYNVYNNIYNQNILNTINIDSFNFNYSIFNILKYATEVYSDILTEINYFLDSKIYCKRDYMKPNNIPILFRIYNNYYNNQISTDKYELTNTNINNVIPITINIEIYVNSFINLYFKAYTNNHLLKTVYLDKNSALIFIGKTDNPLIITKNDYIYYYINVANPSPVLIFNNNPFSSYYSTVNSFVNDFIVYYTNYLGGAKAIEKKLYSNGGLYPNLGTNTMDSQNIGYVYNFYLNSNIVGIAYLTLETDINGSPLGNGLALDFNISL